MMLHVCVLSSVISQLKPINTQDGKLVVWNTQEKRAKKIAAMLVVQEG